MEFIQNASDGLVECGDGRYGVRACAVSWKLGRVFLGFTVPRRRALWNVVNFTLGKSGVVFFTN